MIMLSARWCANKKRLMEYLFFPSFSVASFFFALPVHAQIFELSGRFDPSGHLPDVIVPNHSMGLEIYYRATRDIPICRYTDSYSGVNKFRTKSIIFDAQVKNDRYHLFANLGKGEGGVCEYKVFGGKLTGPFVRLLFDDEVNVGYFPNLAQMNEYSCSIQEAFIGTFKEYCILKSSHSPGPIFNASGNGVSVDFSRDFKNANFDIVHRGILTHPTPPENLLKTLTFPSGATLKFYKNGEGKLRSNSPVVLDGFFHPQGISPGVRRMRFSFENYYSIYPEIDARAPTRHEIVVLTEISSQDRDAFRAGKWVLKGYQEFLKCNEIQDENFDTVYIDLLWEHPGTITLRPGEPFRGAFVYCFKNRI